MHRHPLRAALAVLLVVLGGSTVAALAYAPYLPQLVFDGYPSLIGPAKAKVVPIEGIEHPRDLGSAMTATVDATLQTLFDNSEGRALLVFHRGRLLLEHYGSGVTPDTPLNSYSIAKSLVGALVYKALAEGRLASLDATLGETLPEFRDDPVSGVTIRSLLVMRSGLSFETHSKFGGDSGSKDLEATATNPFGPLARLHFLGLGSIEHELVADTATVPPFSYQNVNTALLGAVLEGLYGRPLAELLAEKIWRPAAAASASWLAPSMSGEVAAYCCVFATARDWIRIGAFLMENGTGADPFLPEGLWREFLGLDLSYAEVRRGHYGQHVWQDVLDRPGQSLQGQFTYLFGQNGQILYLMPERDLVVYRAGEKVQLLHSTLYGAWNTAATAATR
jgi:CubicO group peptidase (beta-lactamase class C family)